jgi:hypothetical protein
MIWQTLILGALAGGASRRRRQQQAAAAVQATDVDDPFEAAFDEAFGSSPGDVVQKRKGCGGRCGGRSDR